MSKNGCYPIGHPNFIYAPASNDLTPYFGKAKVTILLPERLFHLPVRINGKLTFALCRTCTELRINDPRITKSYECPHSDTERHLTGTWCMPEILKAVDLGYTIIKVHEIWHFNESLIGLFCDYVNTWLKIKEEASSRPANCTITYHPHQRKQHISN